MNAAVLERPRPASEANARLAEQGETHAEAAHRLAQVMFEQGPDWVTFFREVLGIEGIVRKLYPSPTQLAAFEQTAEYAAIQRMLGQLRERGLAAVHEKEQTRVITVRLPKSLHHSLKVEAHDRQTTMNQLCISKLLRVLDLQPEPLDPSHS